MEIRSQLLSADFCWRMIGETHMYLAFLLVSRPTDPTIGSALRSGCLFIATDISNI